MSRNIKPFDDSFEKDRRRTTEDSSSDTSGYDAYRQGVELTSPKHFANGIAKIHSGHNGQSGNHEVPTLTLGQGRARKRDENSFLEGVKYDPLLRFENDVEPVWNPRMASVALLAWYRADLGLSGVSPLVGIGDQSGMGDSNRNQVVTNGTLNAEDAAYGGQATVSDLQTTRVGTWTNTPAVPITIIVVGEITNVLNGAFLSDPIAGENMLWKDPLFAKFYTQAGALFSNIDISTPSVTMYSDDGSIAADAAKIYVNDLTTPNNYDVTVFQPVNGLDIGRGIAGVADLSGGKIAEIIIYKGILAADDLINLRTYLNVTRAYGIAVT